MEDDAELLLERVEEEMAEEYSEEEDGYVDIKGPEKCLIVFNTNRPEKRPKILSDLNLVHFKTRDVLHIDELGAFPGNERTGSGTRVQHERPEPYLQSR